MNRLISKGDINPKGIEHLGQNGDRLLLSFERGSLKIEKDMLLSPFRNKACILQVRDFAEFEDMTIASVILVDSNKEAWMPKEYMEEGSYWVKLGIMQSFEREGTVGSIQFSN